MSINSTSNSTLNNSILNHNHDLKITSINANNSLKKNIINYSSFLHKENIDILLIQEPGPFTNSNDSQTHNHDKSINFHLKQINYVSYTNWQKDERYSLVIITKKHLVPIIKKVPPDIPHIQHITITTNIGTLNIINTYIHQNKQIREATIKTLNLLTKCLNKSFIIGGDLNSFPYPELDYFSNMKSKYNKKEKQRIFNTICHDKLIDSFRFKNSQKKAYTKWTITSTTSPTRITATRLDHLLVTNNLKKRILSVNITYNDEIHSDHLPITLVLLAKTPKINTLNNKHTQKLPHWSLWPKDLSINIENDIAPFLNININSSLDIENITKKITDTLQSQFKKFADSLQLNKQHHPQTNSEHSKIKNLRHTLLNTKKAILNHINRKKPLPNAHLFIKINSDIIHLTKSNNPNLISLYNQPDKLLIEILSLIKLTTKLLHKINKKVNLQHLKYKINKILKHKELSSKIIYKIIKGQKISDQINFIIENKDNDIKLVVNPNKIASFVFNKYNKAFDNATLPKSLSHWLKYTPTLTEKDLTLPDTSTENVRFILTNRANTAPGIDKIQFDIFKFLAHHNSSIFTIISNLYTKIIYLNHIPKTWKKGITTLIPKNDSNNNSWRPITLLNTLYKGLSLIINIHIQNILTTNHIIPQEQCGFNKTQDTSSAIITYLETIKLSKQNNLPLHAIYIDFKAAFDSVQHWTIPQILKHIQINETVINIISNLISDSLTSFILQDKTTPEVTLKTGVKQGDPLSPTLFLLYLLPIQWFLNNNHPKTITNINHLCYADDMLILSHSRHTLESLFGQLSIYTYYTDMNINTQKTMYTFMNDTPQPLFNINILNNENKNIQLNIPLIDKTSNYKYLGLEINLCLDFQDTIKSYSEKYKEIVLQILKKKYLGLNLIIKLINTIAIPKISYIMNFIKWSNQDLDDLDNFTTTHISKTFHIPLITPNQYWFAVKNLKSVKDTNIIKYHSTYLDRTINSNITMKNSPTIINHIQNQPYISKFLPPIQTLLNNLNISLKTKTQNIHLHSAPQELYINFTDIDIYTDASLHKTLNKGCCSIYIPQINYSQHFAPHYPISSTSFELQSILYSLQICKNIPNINLYTDSLSSIKAIENFHKKNLSKQLQNPNYPIITLITKIIDHRKKNHYNTILNHVYSHLLDTKNYPEHKDKLKLMKLQYNVKTIQILLNNKLCDEIASKYKHNILNFPDNHLGLPHFYYSYNKMTYTSIIPPLKDALTNFHKLYLKTHQTKRSEWFFSESCNQLLTTMSPIIQYQNITPKLTQSLIFTKERAHKFYQKTNLKLNPHLLSKRRTTYDFPYCHLCPNSKDNHEHGSTSCYIAKKINDILAKKIFSLIKKSNPKNKDWKLNLCFTTSFYNSHITNNPNQNFHSKWGDRGIIPQFLTQSVHKIQTINPTNTIINIISLCHKYTALKWKIKFYSIYNKQISKEALLDSSFIKKILQ